jgi:Solitary outer membrane autotransporter beta-barrel domain
MKNAGNRATQAALCFFFAGACLAAEDDVGDFEEREAGAGYAHLISFEAEPEIAAASYTVDSVEPLQSDANIDSFKLPLYREFSPEGRDWRWYAQGSLSYLTLDETFYIDGPTDQGESLDMEWTAYGALVEMGLIYPLARGFSLVFGAGLGVSRLENEADFSSPLLEGALPPEYKGRLYDWETDAALVRGSLSLRYDQQHGNFRIKSSTNLSYSYIDSFSESNGFVGFDDHTGTFTFKLDARHPLDWEIRKHSLYLLGHVGNTTFVGDNRNSLGFKYFNEVGLSLGFEEVTFGALAIFGSDVEGWTVALNYDY